MHSLSNSILLLSTVFAFTQPNCSYGDPPRILTNSVNMTMVLIPKGDFVMGSPKSEPDRRADEQLHKVILTKDYYLGCCEVTQAQYCKVMGVNPSHFQGDAFASPTTTESAENKDFPTAELPVETVKWNDAVEFCRRLSERPEEKALKRTYRLPTEAEWEYACRAGSETSYSFGDNSNLLGEYAWYVENSNGTTHRVGSKKPNNWGLFDMHGNVDEFCADTTSFFDSSPLTDPLIELPGRAGIVRGGSWESIDFMCRSAVRVAADRERDQCSGTGFRVVLTPTTN